MPAPDGGGLAVELAQEPEVEGAVVALEVGTGQVKALVGGWDFDRSKFDRATQALRQVGSAFKPFVYAAAIDNGYGQNDLVEDVPLELRDPRTGRIYAPQNYDHAFLGPIPMWKALAQSRNVPAVRMLMSLGAPMVVDYARLCGITSKLAPYPSLALGAAEVTPLEMARAYSVFANRGVMVEPSFLRRVVDQDGRVVEESRPRPRPVLSAATAAVMTDLLGEVIRSGTATKARRLGKALAGKTGTTNDYTDAWFVGYSPTLVVAVWVGHDERRTLGRQRTGGKVALPIWMDVMAAHLETHPAVAWADTPGVVWVKVDRVSGRRAGPDCPQAQVALQAFPRDRQPDGTCTAEDHAPASGDTDEDAEAFEPSGAGPAREEHRLPHAPLVAP
jgi:penicillin-binding protein 1A